MKRFTYIIALVLTLVTMASCTNNVGDTPVDMQLASNDLVDYNLYVPDNWTVETSTGVITAKYSDSITVNVNMMAATAPDGVTDADAYWKSYVESFGSTFTEWELVSEDKMLLDEVPANRYVYTGAVGGSKTFKFMQAVCVKDGVIYLFTYTADPEQYERYYDDVTKMLDNFSFKR